MDCVLNTTVVCLRVFCLSNNWERRRLFWRGPCELSVGQDPVSSLRGTCINGLRIFLALKTEAV